MRKRPIRKHSKTTVLYVVDAGKTYAIPKKIAEKYLVKSSDNVPAEEVFSALNARLTKPAALLKGLRTREGLTQVEFAEMIDVTQANLSNMENGRRPIGKKVASRIEVVFGVNYRYFLE